MRSSVLTFILATTLAYLAFSAEKGSWILFAASLWVIIRHFILTEEAHYEDNPPSLQDSKSTA